MPVFEERKELIYVISGFLILYLAAYIIFISPNSDKVSSIREKSESKYGNDRKELFGEGISLDFLIREYSRNNKELEASLSYLKDYTIRPFTEGLLPEDKISRRHAFVRENLEAVQGQIRFAAGNHRVHLKEDVFSLGVDLPEEYTESLDQDKVWLAQIEAARQLILLILRVDEGCGDNPGIVQINSIKPKDPSVVDTNPSFIREYPLEVEMFSSIEGLMMLLHKVSEKGSFYILNGLSIISEPGHRSLKKVEGKPVPMGKQGYRVAISNRFYYHTKITLSRIELLDATTGKVEEKKPEKKVYKPIAY